MTMTAEQKTFGTDAASRERAEGCGIVGDRRANGHRIGTMTRKKAGRILDGRTWDEYPRS